MHNPFEFFNQPKKSQELFVDTSRTNLQIDQLPWRSTHVALEDTSKFVHFRLRWVGILVLVVLSVLCIRLFYLQGVQGQELREQAEGNRLREQRIAAARGVFFDRSGLQLVKNVPDFKIVLNPKDLPRNQADLQAAIQQISDVTHISVENLQQTISHTPVSQPSVTLQEHLEYQTAIQLMIEFQNLPGIRIETSFKRSYAGGQAWSSVLGYMGKISSDEWEDLLSQNKNYSFDSLIGKTGLEASYEDMLRGLDGQRMVEVNAKGKEQAVVSSHEAVAGQNVTLTIDNQLQQAAQQSLDAMLEKKQAPGGAAVVLDVASGEVLALVTAPTFDHEWFARGITLDEYSSLVSDERHPLINRAISGEYPSGSTFKPVVAAAGLAEGVITPSSTVTSVGGLEINGSFFPDWRAGGHGVTDVRKALADSVNTFFYLLGGGDNETTTGLGVERIVEYAKKFGLSEILQIDLPGEQPGFLPSKAWKEEVKNELWYLGDTYHLAIGQGDILVTPLQVAAYTMTMANGGSVWKPHVVKSISSPDGKNTQDIIPQALHSEVVAEQHLTVVRQGMRQAVTSGSARALGSVAWPLAAKTGTAEHAGSDIPHSWITVFGPYDQPEVVVTVIIEEGGEGTEAALPVARDILNFYISQQSTSSGS